MSAKQPEYYQQQSEKLQRELDIATNLLNKSEKCVEALKEALDTQLKKRDAEKEWLQARLKKNSRSPAYWAKHRLNNHKLEPKPAWGVRCACTEPERGYSLKDQSYRIVELEATVAARDLTITRLRESRLIYVRKNDTSTSNAINSSLPSAESSGHDSSTGSQIATTTLVHACEHEEHCKNLGKQVTDDAETITELRKECQDLKEAASNNTAADATGIDTKDTEIEDLREELVARNEKIDDLKKQKLTASEELAETSQQVKDLEEEKVMAGEKLAAKNEEIKTLREEKTTAAENAAAEITNLGQELSESRKDLSDEREVRAECERQLGQQTTRVKELEESIEEKDSEIDDLEKANQELAEQPAPESAENLRRLMTANTNLDDLRREHAECAGRLETQTARNSVLEVGGRELEATIQAKDHRIAVLEEQINNAPSNDLIERQNRTHDEAIRKKDREYRSLYDLYQKVLGQQKLAETKHNEDMRSLNTMQQSDNEKQLELQRLWTEYHNFRGLHTNCDGRVTDLTNRIRQGANTHTDLQTKYNTQATELDVANKDVRELQSQVANLQLANTNLEQMNSSSESTFEKYRVEGEDRARPLWQAKLDREVSAQAMKLEASERNVFKLESQLQQAKNQKDPLREMQLKEREDAVKAREEELKLSTDAMDHDQRGSKADPEIKTLEGKLAAANKEAGDAKARNRGIQNQLTKERKERSDEKTRHEKELKKEKEDFDKRTEILKLRLEKDNPLKSTVGLLQNQVANLSKALEARK